MELRQPTGAHPRQRRRRRRQRAAPPLPPAAAAWGRPPGRLQGKRSRQLGLPQYRHRRMAACCLRQAVQRPPQAVPPRVPRPPPPLLRSVAAPPAGRQARLRPCQEGLRRPAVAALRRHSRPAEGARQQAERRRRRRLQAAGSKPGALLLPPVAMWAAAGPQLGPFCVQRRGLGDWGARPGDVRQLSRRSTTLEMCSRREGGERRQSAALGNPRSLRGGRCAAESADAASPNAIAPSEQLRAQRPARSPLGAHLETPVREAGALGR